MKLKKLSAVFLSVIMLVAFAVPISAAAKVDPQIQEPEPPPINAQPYIYAIDTTVFQAGDVLAVPITLSVAQGYASNVKMKLAGPEGKEDMFSFYNSTGWFEAGDVYTKTNIKPYIQVSSAVPDGRYAVTVNLSYICDGELFKGTDKISIIVQGKSNKVLYTKSAGFSKAEIGKDNKSELIVNIMNPSVESYGDVKVSFNTAASKGFSLYENFGVKTIGNIPSQGSSAVKFSVYVDSTIATGNYPLTIDMSYKDAVGTTITSSEVVYVQVTRSADAGTGGKDSTPRIIVSSYATDVKEIKAGQEFTLDFTLKNTSAKVAVNNIKVVMGSAITSGTGAAAQSSGGAVFFPAEGSNSFYIPKMASQGTQSNKIKLMARQDVEPGVYPVMLKIDYEDASGNALSSEEQVSFAVTQEQRLDVQALTIPTDAMMGSGIPLNFQYINKGKATIYNLSVTVEGDFTLEGGSQYVGNLTAGYNDYFDNVIMPSKEGSLKGEVVLKFENSNGNEMEQRTPITCNVSPMIDGGEIGKPGMGGGIEALPAKPKGGLLSKILWIGIPTLVIVAGVLAFLIIMKKRKAKKVLVEDEED